MVRQIIHTHDRTGSTIYSKRITEMVQISVERTIAHNNDV